MVISTAAVRRLGIAVLLGALTLPVPGFEREGSAVSEIGATDEMPAVISPDLRSSEIGGVAARLRHDDGRAVVGDFFFLMSYETSRVGVQVWDDTPYVAGIADPHPLSVDSNARAVAEVRAITGETPVRSTFTSAPGGGHSGGLIYALAYLSEHSDGALTAGLTVSATGGLDREGYLVAIDGIDQKTVAARIAGAQVMFTTVLPTEETARHNAARVVGHMDRAKRTSAALSDERRWSDYELWGASRPGEGLDVVGVEHVGDALAYLCGAGSTSACEAVSAYDLSPVAQVDGPAVHDPVAIGDPEVLVLGHGRVDMRR